MKIGFVIYEGMTSLDFIGVYDPLTRLKTMGFLPDLEWEVCGWEAEVRDGNGLKYAPTWVGKPLGGFDMLIVPGGSGSRALEKEAGFLDWLKTAASCKEKISVCTGALLLGAAGFLEGKSATTHPAAYEELKRYSARVLEQRIVEDGDAITAGGVAASIDLGLYLCEKIAGTEAAETIRRQMDYWPGKQAWPGKLVRPAGSIVHPQGSPPGDQRKASVARKTRETSIELSLDLDGSGQAEIETGLGFFDHMLTQIAVHGLFDLQLKASGDLQVDAHHTVEDVALALGKAFDEALGRRTGIVRAASCTFPMDEALASVAVDFSGRPYAVIETDWKTPAIGSIPTRLFDHFCESFAVTARCNLHARLLYGRDDHHQAEALFKALARALDAATRIDPRRAEAIPSSKGSL